MGPDKIRTLAKQILNSVPGGMEGPDIAQLAMQLVSILVFRCPAKRRDEAIAQLEQGFQAAIAEGKARALFRETTLAEAAEATKQ